MRGRSFLISIILFTLTVLAYHVAVGASNEDMPVLEGYTQRVESDEAKANISKNNGLAMAAAGQYIEAIQSFNDALNLTCRFETKAELWKYKGDAYRELKQYGESVQSYNEALNQTEQDNIKAEISFGKALSLHELNQFNEAIKYYDEALNLKDDWSRSHKANILKNKGLAMAAAGQYSGAIQSFNDALNLTYPDEIKAELWKYKGDAYSKLKQCDEALQSYDESLNLTEQDNTKAEIWYKEARAYYELKKYNDAINSYNKSLEFNVDKLKLASLNNRGLAMNWTGRYDEAIASYDEALNFTDPAESNCKNNTIVILNNKGNALKQLNRSAEAAMVYSKANDLDMGPQKKSGIFIAFLLLYSVLASAGYVLYRRTKPPLTAVMLSANLLGFLAVVWIFSGLFDPALIRQLLLVGLMMTIIAGTLWSFLGLPSDPWKTQIILTFRDFERKGASICGMIKATCVLAAIGYIVLASAFYFRFKMNSEEVMADFLGWALLVITLAGLFVALPPIMGALLSENLDRDSRDILQIILFSYLGIVFFYLLLILWSFQIGGLCLHDMSGGISLNISPIFLGTAMSLLLFAFLLPYLSGWMRAKRHTEMLLQREISWIDRLLNVLEFPTPSLYVQKLGKILSDIDEDKTVSDLDNDETSLTTLREHGLHLVDPRLKYEVFMGDLQDRIRENIQQFEELKDDEETLMKRAQIYAEAYRIRKDEIIGSVDKERNIKPKLLIILIFVLAPILTQILSKLSVIVTESLSKLVSCGILT